MGSAFSANIGVATQLFHIRDEKSSDVDAGTFTSGTWQTRELNTAVLNEIPGASLSGNQLTLPAGTYHVEAAAPALFVSAHKLKLRNITLNSDIIIGTAEYTGDPDIVVSHSSVRGTFILSATSVIELQHKCQTTKATNGLGIRTNVVGSTEIYAEILLRREIPAVNDGNGTLVNGPLLHVRDEKSAGTNGGTFTSGSWVTRAVNTVIANGIVGASLSGNQIILPAGSYYIEAMAPGYYVNNHKAKLRDAGNSLDLIIGSSEHAGIVVTDTSQTSSSVTGRFTLGSPANLEIRHRCTNTNNGGGFGLAINAAVNEVYTDVKIWQLVRAGSSDTNVITAGLLGEVRSTIIAAAPPGWIMLTGSNRVSSLGNPSSGAARANADTEDLFIAYWNEMADAQAPVSTGRGGGAAADYAANKTLTMPDPRGRSIIGTGTGASLTARIHGGTGGAETHQLSTAELAVHNHLLRRRNNIGATGSGVRLSVNSNEDGVTSTKSSGSDSAHANMQPWLAFNVIQKL